LRHIDGTWSGDLVDQQWLDFQAMCANTNKRDASRQSITLITDMLAPSLKADPPISTDYTD
jgi:hypothetical protein